MASYGYGLGSFVEGLQGGLKSGQDYRARKQMERYREQALQLGHEELEARAGARQDLMDAFNDETAGLGITPYKETLDDPMGIKLWKNIKAKFGSKKKTALPLGASPAGATAVLPQSTPEEEYGVPMETSSGLVTTPYNPPPEDVELLADGGMARPLDATRSIAQNITPQLPAAPTPVQMGGGALPLQPATGVLDTQMYRSGGRVRLQDGGRLTDPIWDRVRPTPGGLVPIARGIPDEGIEEAPPPIDPQIGLGMTPFGRGVLGARYAASGREAIPEEEEEGGVKWGKLGKDAAMYLLANANPVVGATLLGKKGYEALKESQEKKKAAATEAIPTTPAATRRPSDTDVPVERTAVPSAAETAGPNLPDFGEIEMEAKDVPNMTTGEWTQYRRMIIRDAARRGQNIDEVNQRITGMQMKNFQHYATQGLYHMQAGNDRAAMAALRAGFQYFPNGYDVEFGLRRNNRTGKMQIVGFGKDENTGEIVPGSEMPLTPDRLNALVENLTKPGAWSAWVKDERESQQRLRAYEEVEKPLAEAQAGYYGAQGEAALSRAAGAGAYGQTEMRGDIAQIRGSQQLQGLALEDPKAADYLSGIAGQLRARYPNAFNNEQAVTIVMNAWELSGKDPQKFMQLLQQSLSAPRAQGIPAQVPGSAPAVPAGPGRTALPVGGTQPVGVDPYVAKTFSSEAGRGGGIDYSAKNPRSSATGPGQFLNRTWLELYPRVYPNEQRSEAEILALRTNPQVAARMTKAYGDENARILTRAGFRDTHGNRYLAHHFGPSGALALLRAAPNTPVERILDADVIASNPEVTKGKTAAQLIAWVNQRVS